MLPKSRNQLENKILPYIMLKDAISSSCELVERILPKSTTPSLRVGLREIESVLEQNIVKAEENLPIVGYHFSLPAEYLFCFECVPICIESLSFILAALLLDGVEKYYDIMLNWGHPFHTCSSQRATLGFSLDDLIKFDAIITPTAPCDNTCASYPFFLYKKKIPLVIMDLPYTHSEKSYEFFASQLKNGLKKLGKILGQEPDFDRMKKHIEIENRVSQIKLEIFDLIRAIPSPIDNLYNAISAATTILLSGTRENITFYSKIKNMAKKRYVNGDHYGKEETIRSIWPYMLTFFDISLCEWLDRELGLSILFDIFNYSFSDPIDTENGLDNMFFDMAKKTMNFPMTKQSTELYYPFIEDCVKMAKDYSADCFIYTSSIACKQFGSVPKLLREALREEVGIPMLLIELDVGDARVTSIDAIKNKISMFTQTLL
jgi:benzoyl-CoA reductase/2-hydroxyglutaryl-CoA dehydratase subunit BcrC/BadD/HgdB